MLLRIGLTLTCLSFVFNIYASCQTDGVTTIDSVDGKYLNWYNLDPKSDKIMGGSVDRVYQDLIANREPGKTIIVAVLDSGVDIDHEDLQGKIWINSDEIAGNGIDDDGNGYIDDVHGWNFLGNSDGKPLNKANYEQVRIYRDLKDKYENVESIYDFSHAEKKEAEMFFNCKQIVDSVIRVNTSFKNDLEAIDANLREAEIILKEYLETDIITENALKKMQTPSAKIQWARDAWLFAFRYEFTYSDIQEMLDEVNNDLDVHYNLDFNPRTLIGDDVSDINDNQYGNNLVKGVEAVHGTFVAGIIAATRDNGIGINGIADNVRIMVLRVVPNGDEYDKDVALAVRYAVDNGANIINMSFGKDFSPQKSMVDEAMKYAEDNNVLLVHASGNDSQDLDKIVSYPTDKCDDEHLLSNWVSVGASGQKKGKYLPADFSNYGETHVDLFAPGVNIVSTRPNNKYDVLDGTSFSCPVTSGVAALVWSYFPNLSAVQLKEILEASVYDCGKTKVFLPYEYEPIKTKYRFSTLSVSGGIVNAFNAFKLAESVSLDTD
jgi:subtilisin family serine protease